MTTPDKNENGKKSEKECRRAKFARREKARKRAQKRRARLERAVMRAKRKCYRNPDEGLWWDEEGELL